MYNLFKMELYRISKSLSTWIYAAITVLVVILVVVVTNVDIQAMAERNESISTERTDTVTVEDGQVTVHTGFYFDTAADWIDNDINIFDFMIVTLRSCTLLLLMTIFTAQYFNAENKGGFVKNVAGRLRHRGNLFLAKLPGLFIFTLFEFVVACVTCAVAVRLIIGGIDLSLTTENAKTLVVMFLLHFALNCVIAFLTVLTKNTVVSSSLGIVICAGMFNLIYSAVDILIEKMGAENFSIQKYSLVGNIQLVGSAHEMCSIQTTVLIGAAFILVTSVLSYAIMNKRDV